MFRRWNADRKAKEEERKIREEMAPQLKKAKEDGELEELADLKNSLAGHIVEIWEPTEAMRTDQLLRKAHRLNLDVRRPPFPPIQDEAARIHREGIWRISTTTGGVYLTDKGARDLEIRTRKEIMERFTVQTRWVPIIFGFMGLLIGLFSKAC